eukprot:COSAG06_NODE_44735_length_361_cov_0.587786_1_plen_24_part_10
MVHWATLMLARAMPMLRPREAKTP